MKYYVNKQLYSTIYAGKATYTHVNDIFLSNLNILIFHYAHLATWKVQKHSFFLLSRFSYSFFYVFNV